MISTHKKHVEQHFSEIFTKVSGESAESKKKKTSLKTTNFFPVSIVALIGSTLQVPGSVGAASALARTARCASRGF